MMGLQAAGILGALQVGQYIVIGLFLVVVVGLYIWGSRYKAKDSRAEMLQRRYSVLEREKLDGIPDEELVEAVAANVMAKVDKRHPNLDQVLARISHGRCAVYCVWILCKELDEGSFEELLAGPTGQYLELAADGLDAVGAPGCAAAARGALDAQTEEERAELHADFLEQAEEEKPLEKCVEYIRDNPEEFVDEGILGETPEKR